jgi:hypothetical protein
MAEAELFGFEKDEIRGGLLEKYKGKKGEVHRCGIVYIDPKAMFAGHKIHFKERFFICKKGKCCEVCGEPKWRIGAVLIKYGTDRAGNIKKPLSYELFPWIFSEQNYVKLKNLNNDFALATHDLKIGCDNDEYQHLIITPCPESIWIAKDELKTLVLDQAKSVWEYVKRSLAADLSVEEINDLLGLSSAAGTDPTTKIDLDSVLEKI